MKNLLQIYKTLSEEARLRIINLIIESGELCVCDLQRVLGFTQTTVSRLLAYLKHSKILQDRRMGGWILYSLLDADDPEKNNFQRAKRCVSKRASFAKGSRKITPINKYW